MISNIEDSFYSIWSLGGKFSCSGVEHWTYRINSTLKLIFKYTGGVVQFLFRTVSNWDSFFWGAVSIWDSFIWVSFYLGQFYLGQFLCDSYVTVTDPSLVIKSGRETVLTPPGPLGNRYCLTWDCLDLGQFELGLFQHGTICIFQTYFLSRNKNI